MALYICRICGNTLKAEEGYSICTCPACGTTQDLADLERKAEHTAPIPPIENVGATSIENVGATSVYVVPNPEKPSKKGNWLIAVLIGINVLLVAFGVLFALTFDDYIKPAIDYNKAMSLYNEGDYPAAQAMFESLGDYQDSAFYAFECANIQTYTTAWEYLENNDYKNAIDVFCKLGDFRDAADKQSEARYLLGCEYYDQKDYATASSWFNTCKDYKDAAEKSDTCKKLLAEQANEETYQRAMQALQSGQYAAAESNFQALGDYKDSKDMVNEAKYRYVYENQNSEEAGNLSSKFHAYIKELKAANYKDIASIYVRKR